MVGWEESGGSRNWAMTIFEAVYCVFVCVCEDIMWVKYVILDVIARGEISRKLLTN